MSDPFIGEIRVFANTFIPAGWLPCDGRTLSMNQYTALFSIVGTLYGGDGRTTFAIPNLNGRAAVHPGVPPTGGVHNYILGRGYGDETIVLRSRTMPSHRHQLQKKNTNATPPSVAKTAAPSAKSDLGGLSNAPGTVSYQSGTTDGTMANMPLSPQTLGPAGAATPVGHENRQPYVAMLFAIAYNGAYPPHP